MTKGLPLPFTYARGVPVNVLAHRQFLSDVTSTTYLMLQVFDEEVQQPRQQLIRHVRSGRSGKRCLAQALVLSFCSTYTLLLCLSTVYCVQTCMHAVYPTTYHHTIISFYRNRISYDRLYIGGRLDAGTW